MTTEATAEQQPDTAAPDAPATDTPAPEEERQPWGHDLEERIDAALGAGAAEEEGAEDAEAEPDADEAAATEEAAAEAGEGPTEEEEAEETDAAEEGDAEGGDPEAEDGDSPVLRFPGRNPDDDDTEIRVTPELEAALADQGLDVQDLVERVNQQRNGYMRGREVREAQEEVQTQRQELDYIYQNLQQQPAAFVAQHINPEMYPDIVRTMLVNLDDDAYDDVLTEIAALDRDPAKRREARLEAREKELEQQAQKRQRTAASEYVRSVRNAITGLVPEDMDHARADEFFDFAVLKLERWAKQNPNQKIQPDQIPALLQELGALDPYGLTPEADARTDTSLPSKDARQDRPADGEPDGKAKRTGKDLTKRARARKNAAAVTPAGAGAANTAGLKARVKGLSFEEKLKELAKAPLRMGGSS